MRITRLFVLLALAVLLAPRAEASRTSVWERNPPSSLTAPSADAATALASLAPAARLDASARADVETAEPPLFDLGDVVLADTANADAENFGLGPLTLVDLNLLRGPPPSYPETRVGGFELLPPFRVGASPSLSLWSRQACGFSCREVVSDSRYDPWGLITSIRAETGLPADRFGQSKAEDVAVERLGMSRADVEFANIYLATNPANAALLARGAERDSPPLVAPPIDAAKMPVDLEPEVETPSAFGARDSGAESSRTPRVTGTTPSGIPRVVGHGVVDMVQRPQEGASPRAPATAPVRKASRAGLRSGGEGFRSRFVHRADRAPLERTAPGNPPRGLERCLDGMASEQTRLQHSGTWKRRFRSS
ncbi:MAG: hypothetical protein IPN03_05960 [Holophagales bacterium]|nr:hypothetical protein [Holophagales bacterium]